MGEKARQDRVLSNIARMSNVYFLIVVALIAGVLVPAQGAANNRMAMIVDSPVLAAFISFTVGTLALFVYMLLAGIPLWNLSASRDAPAIAWSAGLMGAFFVAASVALIPRLGVAMTFSLIIAGQMAATLAIDHFGLFGVEVRPINIPKVLGIVLIIIGVILVRRFQ